MSVYGMKRLEARGGEAPTPPAGSFVPCTPPDGAQRAAGQSGGWRKAPRWLALLALSVALAACGGLEQRDEPTRVYYPSQPPPVVILEPSTVPLAPIEEGPEIHGSGLGTPGVNNPTQAALAAEGQPTLDAPTLTPPPTQATLPMLFSAADGLVLRGTLYGAPVRPAPAVLLLHMEGRDRTSWDTLPEMLQAAGYAALTVDLRGHGETGGTVDWTLAQQDVADVLAQVATLPGVDGRVTVLGAGVGANLGLNACAQNTACVGAVLLSPGLDDEGITAAEGVALLGARPLLTVAADNDANNPADSVTLDGMAAGEHRLILVPIPSHGTDMLGAYPPLADAIVAWLREVVSPPAAP